MIIEIIRKGIIPIPDRTLTAPTGTFKQVLEIPVTIREVSFPPSVYYAHFGSPPSDEIVAGSEEDKETALNRLRALLLDPPPSARGEIGAISQYFRKV